LLIDIESQLLILFIALVLDRVVGDPDWLWRRVPHPVVLFGRAIGFADRRCNRDEDPPGKRREAGRKALISLLVLASFSGALLSWLLDAFGPLGPLLGIVAVMVLLAQKSLADHVDAVASGLRHAGIVGGRRAVAMIVGRDPETLDEGGVSRAAIESLAENFSDGVVAPALWYALLGLPGLFAYKMLNTADSMIGHKSPRHIDFGRAAAIADDWANWPAARLSASLIALGAWAASGGAAAPRALAVARRDHGIHRSPNAGWPEAAMAGALDVALAGPRVYGGERVEEPMLNAAGRAAGPRDIARALAVYRHACSALAILTLVLALVVIAGA
jgi:adenosylcobinamide-phosphate synthase